MSLKERIRQGTRHVDSVRIDTLDADVRLRQLTAGEWNEIDVLELQGQRSTLTGIEFDLARSAEAQFRADCITVAYALSCDGESWTAGEVADMPEGAPAEIAKAVRERRPTKKEVDEARRFRGDADRSDVGGHAPQGDAARPDPR